MGRDVDEMVHEIGALRPASPFANGKLNLAALGKLPPGTVSYQFVSTSNGNDICSRSVEMTSYGPDQKLRIATGSSDDCTSTNHPIAPTGLDGPAGPAVSTLTNAGVTVPGERPRAAETI
jgi:hypothetical protein